MTDDDTKFERARREATTRWTASITNDPAPEPRALADPPPRHPARSYADILHARGDHDAEHGVPRTP